MTTVNQTCATVTWKEQSPCVNGQFELSATKITMVTNLIPKCHFPTALDGHVSAATMRAKCVKIQPCQLIICHFEYRPWHFHHDREIW